MRVLALSLALVKYHCKNTYIRNNVAMNTSELLQEIKKLPVRERILIAEKTIKSIRELEESQALSIAAEALYNEYATNKELTPFTNIDFEDFYETR